MDSAATGFKPVIEPELQALLPPQTDEERAQLEASIRKDGILTPLVVWARGSDHVLLDGHHRVDIAKKIGVTIPDSLIKVMRFDDLTGAKLWALRNQLGRRNLNPSQRAMIAADLATLEVGANQHRSRDLPSQAEAAAEGKVSVPSVKRARQVKKDGAPELVAAVRRGEVDVKSAATVAKLPKTEQAALVAKGPKAVKKAAKTARGRPDAKALLAAGEKRMAKAVKGEEPPAKLVQQMHHCIDNLNYVTDSIELILDERKDYLKFPAAFSDFKTASSRFIDRLKKLVKAGV